MLQKYHKECGHYVVFAFGSLEIRLAIGKQWVSCIVVSVVTDVEVFLLNLFLSINLNNFFFFLDFFFGFPDNVDSMPFFEEQIKGILGIDESMIFEVVKGRFIRELEL